MIICKCSVKKLLSKRGVSSLHIPQSPYLSFDSHLPRQIHVVIRTHGTLHTCNETSPSRTWARTHGKIAKRWSNYLDHFFSWQSITSRQSRSFDSNAYDNHFCVIKAITHSNSQHSFSGIPILIFHRNTTTVLWKFKYLSLFKFIYVDSWNCLF